MQKEEPNAEKGRNCQIVLLDSRDTGSPLDFIFHEFLLHEMVESKVWGRGHSNLRTKMIGGERKPKSTTWHNPELKD